MDIKQLISFVEVVRNGSFSKAAENLFLTQPTVTGHIQRLEKELSTILLNRNNKYITVTKPGAILLEHAINIININDAAKTDIKKFTNNVSGHLEIFSSSIPAQFILPNYLNEFINKFPSITFSIHKQNSQNVINNILDGTINFGIVGGEYLSENLEYIDFCDDHLLLATAGNSPKFGKPYSEVSISALMKEKLIFREKGSSSRKLIEESLSEYNILLKSLNIISYIEDVESIKQLVTLDTGVSFISEVAIQNEIKLNQICPYYIKNINLKRKFYFVYYKNRYLSPLDQAFRDFIINNSI